MLTLMPPVWYHQKTVFGKLQSQLEIKENCSKHLTYTCGSVQNVYFFSFSFQDFSSLNKLQKQVCPNKYILLCDIIGFAFFRLLA